MTSRAKRSTKDGEHFYVINASDDNNRISKLENAKIRTVLKPESFETFDFFLNADGIKRPMRV